MNAPLRRAGVVIFVLFGLLFASLNWIQAYKADAYRTSQDNPRVIVAQYDRPRGTIEADGTSLADNKPTADTLKYLRVYPGKQEYGPVIGYKPVNMLATGIENAENDFLSGDSDQLVGDRIHDMFTGDNSGGGDVVLSLNTRAQDEAWKALTTNEKGVPRGAAVAIDPRTGAIQALVSMPSFDPNLLSSHDKAAAAAAYTKLLNTKNNPLVNRATAQTLPPGSVFKVIDSAAALQNGYTPDTSIPAGAVYSEGGAVIHNDADDVCPSSQTTLIDALTVSCNTAFAQLGVKLGRQKIMDEAKAFGFEDSTQKLGNIKDNTGLPVAASHTGPIANADGSVDEGALAQSSIGQRDVRITPLQGAMIAAAVANGGQQMRPYLVQQTLTASRKPLYTVSPQVLRTPIDSAVAGQLQTMMESVVKNGTGEKAQIDGFTVGGKTGTAQNEDAKGNELDPHGWFIGFAFDDKGVPVSAVCVMLENVPGTHASAEAARIAGLIMKAAAGR